MLLFRKKFTTNCRKINFFWGVQMRHFIKNQGNLQFLALTWQNINLTCRYFLNVQLFWIIKLLFCRKSAKFATVETKFNCGWYFEACDSLFINLLLFWQKSKKFSTNCSNVNFSCFWYFLNRTIFFCVEMYCYFIEN